IGGSFGETPIDRPGRHLGKRQEIKHRPVKPVIAALEPKIRIVSACASFPMPIFRPPIMLVFISAAANVLEKLAVCDGQGIDREPRNLNDDFRKLVIPTESQIRESGTQASDSSWYLNGTRSRSRLKCI